MRSLDEVKPGLVLGRYECLLPIARGGMAAVWAARARGARGFQTTVAVKTMLPALSDDPNFERMFLDEARVASKVRHPNVVQVLDLGEQETLLYIVMEWIDGEPLSSLMREVARREVRIPLPIAIKIVSETALGLHAAHELKDDNGGAINLVHRDVSPQNILISFDGVVKVVDFGIAKATGRLSDETATGNVKGKVPYMSPEQVVAKPGLDRRSDIFAMGVVLFQLTTGRHPFRGEHDAATMANILRRPAADPASMTGSEYPKELAAIVLKALQKEPARRFATAAEMHRELAAVASHWAPVTNEDVGVFISSLLGEEGEKRRKALQQARLEVDGRPKAISHMLADGAEEVKGTPLSVARPLRSSEVAQIAREAISDPASLSSLGPAVEGTPTKPPAKSSRVAWIVAAVLAAVVLPATGVVIGLRVAGRDAQSIAGPAHSAAPSDAVSAASSTMVASSASATPVAAASPSDAPAAPSSRGPGGKGRGGEPGPAVPGKKWTPPLNDPGF
jgi:eukaryotic-like serine/threonine-protein kinase